MTGILIILALTIVIAACTITLVRRAPQDEFTSEQYLPPATLNPRLARTTDLLSPAVNETTVPPPGARLRAIDSAIDSAQQQKLVDDVLAGLERIPPLPHVLFRVLAELENAGSTARSLASIVSTEPVLAATLLRVANSASSGLTRRIISVDDAVAYLGYSTVRSLVLRMKLAELMPQRSPHGYNSEHLWLHSMVVSQVATHLAQRSRGVDAWLVSTIGLLHDIGKLAINSQFPDTVALLWTPSASAPADESFLARERRLFGADHAFIGAFLAAQWKLPDELVDAIRLHHMPDERAMTVLSPELRRATQLVHVANQLAKYAHVYCADMEIDILPEPLLHSLGLPGQLEALLDDDVKRCIDRAAGMSRGEA